MVSSKSLSLLWFMSQKSDEVTPKNELKYIYFVIWKNFLIFFNNSSMDKLQFLAPSARIAGVAKR